MAFSLIKFLKGIVISEENTLTPREVEILPGGTANTKTTIQSSQTTNKTITLPDATDTLAGISASQTLTNKSIDADQNTLSNIDNADIKAGAAIDRSKMASGTASHVLINDGSGVLSSEAQLSPARGGTGTNSTATFPSSGVIVTEDATETLTNKTIDGTTNTLQNIPASALDLASATSLDEATTNTDSTVNIATGTGANVINIGGANSTVNFTGTVNNNNVTNLNVTDKLITINDGGGAGSGGNSGFEIEEAGSPTGYLQTSTDRNSFQFKAPNSAGIATLTPGASSDTVLLSSAAQVVTSKDIDGGTASNTSRLTAPKNTYTNLSALTRKEATLVYGSDTQKLYVDNGSALVPVGSGSGVINYITNPDAETDTVGWGTYNNAPDVSITIASPAVVTMSITPISNPFKVGQKISFSTTGALPTGITADTDYYVTTLVGIDSFRFSSTIGGADINTTGSQSGVHSARMATPYDGLSAMATKVTTLTRSTSSPLVGTASFIITKDAANRRGEGIYSNFTIDSAYKASMLSISFDYTLSSGSLNEGDYQVFVLDVTNSTLIYPTSQSLSFVSGQNYQFQAQFQASPNSTSYRLIVHNTSNNLSASVAKLDNVSVGPKVFTGYSPVFSNPKTFVASFDSITASTQSFYYEQMGKYIKLTGTLVIATSVASSFKLYLPSGYKVSSDFINPGVVGTIKKQVGVGDEINLFATGNNAYLEMSTNSGGSFVAQNGGTVFITASEIVTFDAFIPIEGLSAESKVISEYDGRVVAAEYYVSSNYTPSSSSPVNFDSKIVDSHNSVSTGVGTWRFTAPVSGVYQVKTIMTLTGSTCNVYLRKNGSDYAALFTADSTIKGGASDVYLNIGDYIDITQTTGTTISGTAAPYFTHISITLSSGSQQIQVGQKITEEWYLSTNQAVTADVTTLKCDTKIISTTNSYDPITGIFTAPVTGDFLLAASTLTGGVYFVLYVEQTGSISLKRYLVQGGATGFYAGGSGVTLLSLAKGDTVAIYSDTSVTITGGAPANGAKITHLSIKQVN